MDNISLGPVHFTPEKFENAALFLRLGPPSTLIRHENGAFRKRSSNRRSVDGKHLVRFQGEKAVFKFL